MKSLLLLPLLLLSACATRSLSDKDSPAPQARLRQTPARDLGQGQAPARLVRTTAYCHLEDGISRNALGSSLISGNYYSASADWSRYPAGTLFRVLENGRTYVIDDYGPALVGTDTIDLYVPSMREMQRWGVRQVHLKILRAGSYSASLAILRPRARARALAKGGYIRRMVRDLEARIH